MKTIIVVLDRKNMAICPKCNGTGNYCSEDDLGEGSLCTMSACTKCDGTGEVPDE